MRLAPASLRGRLLLGAGPGSVGAVAGALPVLIGSTAVCDGKITIGAWLLFAVLLLWQFPHFMAIAWLYRDDYRSADVLMATTVDDTGRLAGWHAIVFAAALIPVTLLAVWPTGLVGVAAVVAWILTLIVLMLGLWYQRDSIRFFKQVNEDTSRKLFRVSLLYLTAYLVVLSVRAML